jgi:hypothetical protein
MNKAPAYTSSTSPSSGQNLRGAWGQPAAATELLRPELLYLGPRVRRHVDQSTAAAELEQFQRQFNPNSAVISREMSAPFFEEQPGANFNGAVAFVGCKTGQNPHRSLPLGALTQLVALEKFARSHPGVAAFALVGLESANRGLVKIGSQNYELLCRYAFKVSRLIEQQKTLLSRATPVLDCDVLYTPDAIGFSRRRKEQDVWDPDRIATAVKCFSLSTAGVQLKVGASNFASRREIETARKFGSRGQMSLFSGQTVAEDEQLKGEMGFLYCSGPATPRLGQLVLNRPDIEAAMWLQVDHLTVSEPDFRVAWREHEQLDDLYRLISELDPTLSIVDERLAWTLDCSKRMLDFHDQQLFEISTDKGFVSAKALENLKRDYSRAMRTYLRDLAARNFDWLLRVAERVGFQVEAAAPAVESPVVAKIGPGANQRSKAA